jgi:hypothetical protein
MPDGAHLPQALESENMCYIDLVTITKINQQLKHYAH